MTPLKGGSPASYPPPPSRSCHPRPPIAAGITLSLSMAILRGAFGQPDGFLSAAQSLLTAWIVVRLVTLAIRSPFWSKVAFVVAWPIAALDAFGVLGDVFAWMDTVSFEITPETADRGGGTRDGQDRG